MTLLRLPGPVDPHVHLRDLDWSHKATIGAETAAALAGGYWAVLDMPNTPPTTTTTGRLAAKADRAGEAARCDFGLWFGAHQAGNQAEYASAQAGAVGLKMYCDQTTGDLLVADPAARRVHLRSWASCSDRPVAVHAEGASLGSILDLVRELGTRVHACHVSGADEVGMLRDAKAEGLPVSVGVTPHHLYLTEDDERRLGGYGRVKPPLRTRADQAALWAAVADGTVDVVESDHAPHTRAEKEAAEPAYGMPGLETTLPLMGLALAEGRISQDRLIELLATNAQRIFGLALPGETETIVDMADSWVITDDGLRTSPGWSPFTGMRVRGRVREVRIRGRVAFDGERVLARPGEGRNVRGRVDLAGDGRDGQLARELARGGIVC